MDAWFFWKSLGIGMAVAAPVGPMSLLCIHRTLDHGRVAGLVFGAGIAAADMSYAALAAFGISAISTLLLAGMFWIKLAGSLVLVVLGARMALARPSKGSGAAFRGSNLRALVTAYGLTMSNPPTILFFAGLFTAIAPMASLAASAAFATGVFAGSMLWWIIITSLVARTATLMHPRVMLWVNRISGSLLIGCAAYGFATL